MPVRTIVLGERPPELQRLIDLRRSRGQDLHDEVWGGVYHMAPTAHSWHGYLEWQFALAMQPYAQAAGLVATGAFNLGVPDDFRVPDGGLHRGLPSGVWIDTAALVVEVLSPDDETWEKLPFYARHGVDEVLIVDGHARRITWLARPGGEWLEVTHSAVLDVDVASVIRAIAWPG